MEQKERIQSSKDEIKAAKANHKYNEKHDANFISKKQSLQRSIIDIKTKAKSFQTHDEIERNITLTSEYEGKRTEAVFTTTQYRGNYNLGYSCQLILK